MLLTGFHVKASNVVEVVSIELSSEDVQRCSDHTGSMRVAGCRQETEDGGLVPLLTNGVENVKGIAAFVLCILAAKIYCLFRRQSVKRRRLFFLGLVLYAKNNNNSNPLSMWTGPCSLLPCPILARDNCCPIT